MNATSRFPATLYRLALLAFVIYGLILSIFFPEFSIDGLPALAYFTTQSNILVGLFLLYAITCPRSDRLHIFFRGSTLLCITLTGLVFHLFLVPNYPELFAEGVTFRYHITHTIVPLGFILDWLLLDKKGKIKIADLKYWLIYPALYWIFSMARGIIVGAYPYFFMDPNILGAGSIMLWLLFLIIIFTGLGLLLVALDARLSSGEPLIKDTKA